MERPDEGGGDPARRPPLPPDTEPAAAKRHRIQTWQWKDSTTVWDWSTVSVQ